MGKQIRMRIGNIGKLFVVTGVAGLALTGCSGDAAMHENGDENDVTIAVFNGWDEGIAASELWKYVLQEQGYEVTLEYGDEAPVFTGLAAGDYDVNLDAWLPVMHAHFMDEFGDQIVDLGSWNDEALITFAVNGDAPVTSIDELNDYAEEFDSTIYGIEPGAHMMDVAQNELMPAYGLDDWTMVSSSTPAMFAELERALERGDNIVVTLWRPHWAYAEYDVRDLEDPLLMWGEAEGLHAVASTQFVETHPTAAQWMEDFQMDSDLLHDLENEMFNRYDGNDYGPIVADWVEQNRDYVDSLTNSAN